MAVWSTHFDYLGQEYWHPPLYHLVAGRLYAIAVNFTSDPLFAVRILSVVLYSGFVVLGLSSLGTTMQRKGLPFIVASLLIIFWPSCSFFCSRINNDIAFYAAWVAVLYNLTKWWEFSSATSLSAAIAALGVSFMIKTTSVVPASVLFLLVAFRLRNGFRGANLLNRRLFSGIFILMFGLLVNMSRPIYNKINDIPADQMQLGGTSEFHPPLSHYLEFNLSSYLSAPIPEIWNSNVPFMNYVSHSALYDESFSVSKKAGFQLNLAFLAWIGMTLLLCLAVNRARWTALVPHVTVAIVSILALCVFTILKHMSACQNFRFVYPMLISLVTIYAAGLDAARERRWWGLYWPGLICGAAVPLLGVRFYLGLFL